jgi:hypothetical protein
MGLSSLEKRFEARLVPGGARTSQQVRSKFLGLES